MTQGDDEEMFDEGVAVPEKVRRTLNRNRRGIDYAIVERERGKGRWAKVAKVEVEVESKEATDAQLDAMGTEAVRMADVDAENRGEAGHYRLKIFRTNARGNAMKPTASFRAGEEDEDGELRQGSAGAGDYDEDDLGAVALIMQQQMDMLRQSHDYSLKLVDRVIRQSSSASGSIEELNKTIESLAGHYTLGINMQAQALQLIYEQQFAEKAAELKSENNKHLITILGKAAPEMFKQFGRAMGKRFSGSQDEEAEEEADEEEFVDVEATESEEDDTRTKVEEAMQAMTPEQQEEFQRAPLTMTARTFRRALDGEQLIKLSQALTKSDYTLLLSTTEQEDDIATAEKVLQLKKVLESKLDVALSLLGIFDDEQQAVLTAILSQSEAIKAHLAAEDDASKTEEKAVAKKKPATKKKPAAKKKAAKKPAAKKKPTPKE